MVMGMAMAMETMEAREAMGTASMAAMAGRFPALRDSFR